MFHAFQKDLKCIQNRSCFKGLCAGVQTYKKFQNKNVASEDLNDLNYQRWNKSVDLL